MQNVIFLQILSALIIVLVNSQFQITWLHHNNCVGASYSLTKICVHTQGLQMNEINVIAKHIKPWYQTMHCITYIQKKPSPIFSENEICCTESKRGIVNFILHTYPKLYWSLTTNVPSLQSQQKDEKVVLESIIFISLYSIKPLA